ncbi:MAG: CinA family protein [Thermomicrobiaceae bacterium]
MTNPRLEYQIYSLLAESEITIAAAESCSGGLVASRITSVPGSSAYFLGSVVAYANELKQQILGVSPETLNQRGAVSAECAREMAVGVRDLTGATIAVSTTGIAGPGGGTERKPVGLIYFCCATPDSVTVYDVHWSGDRQSNMEGAAEFALQLIADAARAHPGISQA